MAVHPLRMFLLKVVHSCKLLMEEQILEIYECIMEHFQNVLHYKDLTPKIAPKLRLLEKRLFMTAII